MTVPGLMERIVIGGWPALFDQSERSARAWIADYLAQIVDIDIPELGVGRRTPERLTPRARIPRAFSRDINKTHRARCRHCWR